ncbi:hypothetical protein [Streptomyces inhibens]|uniref:hypothetical protein n=1 Tax=Streptomyces inhibens TaxID=2293571 RepID=UPI000FFB0837|nr:hypothetical protein [Streptomyces inhibens]
MTSESISLIFNLATVFIALTIGVRVGYIVAARGTKRDMEMIDRHFESGRQLLERQQEIQIEADLRKRAREEMKLSYEALGIWLHDLERTLDEIHFGATSSQKRIRDKAQALIGNKPWEVVSPPASLASAEFYWSGEVRRNIRKFQAPYAYFISRTRVAMSEVNANEDEGSSQFDQKCWEHRNELHSIIAEVKDQARKDLLVN